MSENSFYSDFDCAQAVELPQRDDYRTPFQIDRDRIIHTSAFRRLQSKTQVFLSGEYDFYRTRLTHSIEVSQIGRGICQRLQHTSDLLGDDFFVDPDLVEAACLSHDIGHPPFGHTGERTLHRLMRDGWGGFEGNGQTLRMLTDTLFSETRGMNPTRALMDGVLKYKTLYSEVPEAKNHFIYNDQAEHLGFVLGGHDFPADLPPGDSRNGFKSIECQIMDWSDDTAYSLNDVADGVHAGFLTVEKIERWAEEKNLAENEHVLVLLQKIRAGRVESLMGAKIGSFIAAASFEETSNFMSEATNRHRFRLVVDPDMVAECEIYKKISYELVFRSQQLQQLDRKADFVLSKLFEVLAENYVTTDKPGKYQLLSEEQEKRILAAETEAGKARIVCDSIARMTDGVANRTYKRLFDADFGSISDLV